MVSEGSTAGEIAEKLEATAGYINNLCRKMGIKPKGRTAQNMCVQVALFPKELKHTFNLWLRSHVRAIRGNL